MDWRQQMRLGSLTNGLTLSGDPPFRSHPEIIRHRSDLAEVVESIRIKVAEQKVERDEVSNESALIRNLRANMMTRMRRISSSAILVLEGMPGIKQDLRVPRSKLSSSKFIEEAERFLANLQPHLKTLYKNGTSKEAVAGLRKSMKELSRRISNEDTALVRRSRATASIPRLIAKGRDIVSAIDGIIREDFADDVGALHVWTSSRRIPRKPGRPKKKRGGGSRPRRRDTESDID